MQTIKEIGKFLVFMCILAGVWWVGYQHCKLARKFPDPFKTKPKLFIEKFIELQREAGCKRIDAEVGPEVKRKFNARLEAEKPDYFNKCANPYFTASGAPSKE